MVDHLNNVLDKECSYIKDFGLLNNGDKLEILNHMMSKIQNEINIVNLSQPASAEQC